VGVGPGQEPQGGADAAAMLQGESGPDLPGRPQQGGSEPGDPHLEQLTGRADRGGGIGQPGGLERADQRFPVGGIAQDGRQEGRGRQRGLAPGTGLEGPERGQPGPDLRQRIGGGRQRTLREARQRRHRLLLDDPRAARGVGLLLPPHALEEDDIAAAGDGGRQFRVAGGVLGRIEDQVEDDGAGTGGAGMVDHPCQQRTRPAAELKRQAQGAGRFVVLADHDHAGRRGDGPAQPVEEEQAQILLEIGAQRACRREHRQPGRKAGSPRHTQAPGHGLHVLPNPCPILTAAAVARKRLPQLPGP
jgi:hypothetical protein